MRPFLHEKKPLFHLKNSLMTPFLLSHASYNTPSQNIGGRMHGPSPTSNFGGTVPSVSPKSPPMLGHSCHRDCHRTKSARTSPMFEPSSSAISGWCMHKLHSSCRRRCPIHAPYAGNSAVSLMAVRLRTTVVKTNNSFK